MSVFSRLSDIINSNIVSMLDKAEDPEKMVRFMIQEMEDTLIEVKSSAAKMISERSQLEEKIDLASHSRDEWLKRAELAIGKNRDDLAKGALLEKTKCEKLIDGLEQQLKGNHSAFEAFKQDIAALEAKLADAKTKQQSILSRKRTATSRMDIRKNLHEANSNNAFLKFERYEHNISKLEAEVEAVGLPKQDTPLADEFLRLEQETEIDQELSELKKKLGKNAGEDK